jgi:general secretion pathway protein I
MRSASRGFTLLEVIIALIIAGLAAGALYQAAGSGLRTTQQAALYQEAIVRAKSHLDAAVNGTRLVAGEWEGDDGGGFRWRLRIAPAMRASVQRAPSIVSGPNGNSSRTAVLYDIATTIVWRQGGSARQLTLQTEQVGGA